MVLFEHTIKDGSIVIKRSELEEELDRLLKKLELCKNNTERMAYLSGQVRTIKDILRYFDYPDITLC